MLYSIDLLFFTKESNTGLKLYESYHYILFCFILLFYIIIIIYLFIINKLGGSMKLFVLSHCIPVTQAYTAYSQRFDILPKGANPLTEIGFDTCEWIEEELLIYGRNNT